MKQLPDRPGISREISRRGLMISGTAMAVAAALSPRSAASATPDPLAFQIMRDGDVIGRHALIFRQEKDTLHVDIEIDIEINFTFITLFRYSHRNHEVWRDGRLIALDTRTDDDGDEFQVRARTSGDELRIGGIDGDVVAPGSIIPTSYWDPRTPSQTRLLDTQRGRILDVQVAEAGADILTVHEAEIAANKYVMSGDLNLALWYTMTGGLIKIAFEARGQAVEYTPLIRDGGSRPTK